MRLLGVSLLSLIVACAPAPSPVREREPQAVVPVVNCGTAGDEDFEGDGEERLWSYLDWLVRTHGAETGLLPHRVSLAIVRGQPKPGSGGVTAGEISCDGRNYRIGLYRDALSGRSLRATYSTLAHEFFHVVQIRRDDLDCASRPGELATYEREATEFAAHAVPACRVEPSRTRKTLDPRCDVARAEDFEGAGGADLQRFADELAGSLGGGVGLKPGDISIAFTCSTPKAGRRGVIAAEIGCRGARAPFRITLYCHALEGRRLAVAYHAVAREIQHIVQIRRDGLACEGAVPELAESYEQEAVAIADGLVPACR